MADRTPNVASGARTTVSGIAPTRLKIDMGDLYRYETDEGALFVTASILGREQAIAKTVSWHTNELVPKYMRINNGGGYTNAATTFTVNSPEGNYVAPGWLIKFTRTGETCLVAAGGNATTLNVVARKWGPNPALALVQNDEILIIGPAYAENAALQPAITVTETQFSNTVQTMRHNWSVGGLMQAIAEVGGTWENDPDVQRQDMLNRHKRDINLSLLHGEGAVSGATATNMGVTEFIKTNAPNNVNAATVITEPVFEAGNKQWFRVGGRKKILIASRTFAGIINQFPAGVQRVAPGADTYGLEMTDYRSAHGQLRVITDVGLEGDTYDGYAIGLDPRGVKFKYVRDTRMIKNRQGTNVDGYEEEVLTDFAGVYGFPDYHYLWTSAAA